MNNYHKTFWAEINMKLNILFPPEDQPKAEDMMNNVRWTKVKKRVKKIKR